MILYFEKWAWTFQINNEFIALQPLPHYRAWWWWSPGPHTHVPGGPSGTCSLLRTLSYPREVWGTLWSCRHWGRYVVCQGLKRRSISFQRSSHRQHLSWWLPSLRTAQVTSGASVVTQTKPIHSLFSALGLTRSEEGCTPPPLQGSLLLMAARTLVLNGPGLPLSLIASIWVFVFYFLVSNNLNMPTTTPPPGFMEWNENYRITMGQDVWGTRASNLKMRMPVYDVKMNWNQWIQSRRSTEHTEVLHSKWWRWDALEVPIEEVGREGQEERGLAQPYSPEMAQESLRAPGQERKLGEAWAQSDDRRSVPGLLKAVLLLVTRVMSVQTHSLMTRGKCQCAGAQQLVLLSVDVRPWRCEYSGRPCRWWGPSLLGHREEGWRWCPHSVPSGITVGEQTWTSPIWRRSMQVAHSIGCISDQEITD